MLEPEYNYEEREKWQQFVARHVEESDKNWTVALTLSIFLGCLGVDRFYLGHPWLGMAKLLTIGGFFFWWLLDVILLLLGVMKDGEGGILTSRPEK